MSGKAHVSDFFLTDLVLDGGCSMVSYGTKPSSEALGVVEIGCFEPHTDQCHELKWRLTSGNTLPKPVANFKIGEPKSQ